MARNSGRFEFRGGAGTYFGTGLLAALITIFTLGICYPFALVLRERWRAKHAYIDGRQLVFTGSAWALFGNWIKWFLLMIITLGIYSFWVGPRIARWKWEHTDFATTRPGTGQPLDEAQHESALPPTQQPAPMLETGSPSVRVDEHTEHPR